VCKENVGCGIQDIVDTTCNEGNVGKLIKDNSNNVKVCTSKTASQTLSTNGIVKYYNVTITSKTGGFCGVSINNVDATVNDKANILIRIDDKSIVQYNDKGYILYSSRWDIMEGSKKNLQVSLSYCDYKVYTGRSETVQCHAVTDIKNGWYFSEINRGSSFIECTVSNWFFPMYIKGSGSSGRMSIKWRYSL